MFIDLPKDTQVLSEAVLELGCFDSRASVLSRITHLGFFFGGGEETSVLSCGRKVMGIRLPCSNT